MGKATVETQFGFRLELQLHDWVDQYVYVTGTYEDMTASTIAALIGPGDDAVDVGANIGFFTLLMATRVGPTGTVWAFEPSPHTRRRLLQNVEMNGAAQVRVREEALSNVEAEQAFYSGTADHSGIASLRPLQESTESYPVRTCRLANCLPPTAKPRLIKIDVEGAEYLALQGMTELLRDQHPDIVIEMSDHFLGELGSSAAEVHGFLAESGYRMFWIDWNGLIPYPRWDPTTLPRQFNALFTTRETLPDQLVIKSRPS
jgi:FkbM family methyltransferase